MLSIPEAREMANEFAQAEIQRKRVIAARSLEAARELKIRERKALIANKPKRQFSSKDGHYDPQHEWIFRRNDGHPLTDEPLRDWAAQLHRIDIALETK